MRYKTNAKILVSTNDGGLQDIDPINGIWFEGENLVIDNGYNLYEVRAEDITRIEILPTEKPNAV